MKKGTWGTEGTLGTHCCALTLGGVREGRESVEEHNRKKASPASPVARCEAFDAAAQRAREALSQKDSR